ncbi:MAG TPA: hypothetical protein VFA74_09305 [Terriglobales bacterium]|nr:hypothetical protein [Terriglobales bacterium]
MPTKKIVKEATGLIREMREEAEHLAMILDFRSAVFCPPEHQLTPEMRINFQTVVTELDELMEDIDTEEWAAISEGIKIRSWSKRRSIRALLTKYKSPTLPLPALAQFRPEDEFRGRGVGILLDFNTDINMN